MSHRPAVRHFDDLLDAAAARKGGRQALEALLPAPAAPADLARIGDDRWLAGMTKPIFKAGFNWSVVENKWPGFEEAFEGFEPRRWSLMSDDDLDRLLGDTRIVRHARKILSVRDNAALLCALADDHGSAARFFADWPTDDIVGLLDLLSRRGSRLGGRTAQIFLRTMGKDTFLLSPDVTAALIGEGAIDGPPASKTAMAAVQAAFDTWHRESGRPLSQISKVLACTVASTGA